MTESISVDVVAGAVVAIPVPVTAADITVLSGYAYLFGYSIRESTGAATATVEIQDGGHPIAELSLGNGGADTRWFGPMGVCVRSDITLHILSGSITGAIYAGYSR
jgi:hypothetical protein